MKLRILQTSFLTVFAFQKQSNNKQRQHKKKISIHDFPYQCLPMSSFIHLNGWHQAVDNGVKLLVDLPFCFSFL